MLDSNLDQNLVANQNPGNFDQNFNANELFPSTVDSNTSAMMPNPSGAMGNDLIEISQGDRTTYGLEGDDLIFGSLGKDVLFGNDDSDKI
jgi:Ca2+-binding RTX toxin-like protein